MSFTSLIRAAREELPRWRPPTRTERKHVRAARTKTLDDARYVRVGWLLFLVICAGVYACCQGGS